MNARKCTPRWIVLLSLPLLACPAADDVGVGDTGTTGTESDTTNSTSMTSPTSDATSASTSASTSTTSDPDSSSSATDPVTTTDETVTTSATTGESTDSTTGAELCQIMIPPPRECPVPGLGRNGYAVGSTAVPSSADDFEAWPDEVPGGFIVEPDVGVFEECDIWTQNCPEGEKCMPWANDGGGSWNATRCSPLDPNPNDVGDPCTVEGSGVSGIDDCGIGQMCWGVDPETNMGFCLELCSCDPDFPVCNTPNTLCTVTNQGVLPLCLAACNPLDPTACADDEGCYGVGDGFQCAPDVSGAEGAPGDACAFINVCDPGTFCSNGLSVPGCDDQFCCSPFCTLGDDGSCLAGQSCVAWFAEGQAPDECLATIGACVL